MDLSKSRLAIALCYKRLIRDAGVWLIKLQLANFGMIMLQYHTSDVGMTSIFNLLKRPIGVNNNHAHCSSNKKAKYLYLWNVVFICEEDIIMSAAFCM